MKQKLKRRNFLFNLPLWILAFFFGYSFNNKEDENTLISQKEGRLVSDQIGNLSKLGSKPTSIADNLVGRGVNVKDFGAKSDGFTDDTIAINNAIIFAQKNKIYSVFLPAGEYLVNGTILIKDIQISLQGVYGGKDGLGTSIKTTGGIAGDPIIKAWASGGSNPYVYNIAGVKISDIYFDGNNTDRQCIYLQNAGFDGHFMNIWIKNFKRQGFYGVHLWDSIITGVTLINCGTDGIYPAFELDGKKSYDTSNANHIFGLHIEHCAYAILLKRSRHNQFVACKIENVTKLALKSGIVISSDAHENKFLGCMFIAPSCTKSYINTVGKDINNIPYYIKQESPTNPHQANTMFIGCDFGTPSTDIGAKWFDVAERVDFHSNVFHGSISSIYSMKLGSLCTFSRNQTKIISKDTLANMITTTGLNNRIEGNKVSVSVTGGELSGGTIYDIGDANTYLETGLIDGPFYNLFNISNPNNEVRKQKGNRFSSINPKNGQIDLRKTETNAFFIKSPTIITDILGGYGGQLVCINADTNGVVIQNGFGKTKISLKSGINMTLKKNQSVELIYMEYTWKEKTTF
ncbi:glycoside hydrolase family 55 protein [Peribacillus frigoritolerans]|uniref:glycoside hydrolase family 55 protein n=1 Tax=Peribacillus frigoritolerans TaxID=450367 RepID=UPI0021D1D430|nr:glycoside hydrolase family 55 protein [Peribacillus frigoritolerans]MCU6600463.1 glycoside hydrolase family 55 protein [Peribacillus frigoritolerans]